jgi:hypothetical protein
MVYYVTVAGNLIMNGPTGYLVSLGLESVLDATTATMMYNYVALAVLFFIAAFAGARNEARFCITVPIFAGIFIWFGWLHSPQPMQSLAVIIICGLLGIMIYMNEMNHEKYGIKGPGSKLMNIVLFLVLFQAALGLTNSLNLFSSGPSQVAGSQCSIGNQGIGATCDAYGNIQLSSVSSQSQSGGLLANIISAVAALPMMVLTLIVFLIQMMAAIIGAPFLINATLEGLYPGISTQAAYIAFMVVLAGVFYFADLMFLVALVVKPFPGEVTT